MSLKRLSTSPDRRTDSPKRQRSNPSTPTRLSRTGPALSRQPSQILPLNTTDTGLSTDVPILSVMDIPVLGGAPPTNPSPGSIPQPLGPQIHDDAASERDMLYTRLELTQRNVEMETIIQGAGGRDPSHVYQHLRAVCGGALEQELRSTLPGRTDPSSGLLQPQPQIGYSSGEDEMSVKRQIYEKLAYWKVKASGEPVADSVEDEDTVMTGMSS